MTIGVVFVYVAHLLPNLCQVKSRRNSLQANQYMLFQQATYASPAVRKVWTRFQSSFLIDRAYSSSAMYNQRISATYRPFPYLGALFVSGTGTFVFQVRSGFDVKKNKEKMQELIFIKLTIIQKFVWSMLCYKFYEVYLLYIFCLLVRNVFIFLYKHEIKLSDSQSISNILIRK